MKKFGFRSLTIPTLVVIILIPFGVPGAFAAEAEKINLNTGSVPSTSAAYARYAATTDAINETDAELSVTVLKAAPDWTIPGNRKAGRSIFPSLSIFFPGCIGCQQTFYAQPEAKGTAGTTIIIRRCGSGVTHGPCDSC